MPSIAKVDAREHEEQLYAFFTAHRFMGVHNARRVYRQAEPDLWLAREQDVPIGALLGVEEERTGGRRGCLENCLVTDAHRQAGLATRLVTKAEAHYRRKGLAGMEFAVRREWEPYDSLLRAGYEVVRVYRKDKEDWDGNEIRGEERHVIRKDFSRAS